jgi:Tol biopolymer transport system component
MRGAVGSRVHVVHDRGLERARMADANAAAGRPATPAFAWLVVLLAAWLVAGVSLVVWASNHDLVTDAGASPYHVPAWAALATIGLVCAGLVVRAGRHGSSWRTALPTGYGVLAAGFLVLIGYLVLDVAWREGVGIDQRSLEGGIAPSRVVLLVGLVLVAAGPLRAALLNAAEGLARIAAIPSAGLVLTVLVYPGAFNPVASPWFERVPVTLLPHGEIWVMDSDGSHQTRLIEEVEPGVDAGWPAWSPDGRHIAYVVWRSGDPPDDASRRDADIWVANADGTGRRLLVGGPGWQWIPHWSPDGRWIAYTQEQAGGPWVATGPQGPDVGPQGPGFVVEAPTVREDADIWKIPADGSAPPVRLTGGPGDDRSASWSPDGTHLVLDSTRDGNTELYVIAADGSNPRRLTDNPAEDWGASWSPLGNEIAFASSRDGRTGDVYVVGTAGGDVRRITHDPAGVHGPAWSPDGTRIAFSSWQSGPEQILSVAADGSDSVDLSRSPSTDDDLWDGRWSRDGHILFARTDHAAPEASGLVREDLAALVVLFESLVVAGLVVVVLRIRPPFGAYAAILGLASLIVGATAGNLQYVSAGLVAGLVVDLVARYAPDDRRAVLAGMAAGGATVLALGAAAAATTGLGWTPTILLGVAMLAALLGALVGLIAGRPSHAAT